MIASLGSSTCAGSTQRDKWVESMSTIVWFEKACKFIKQLQDLTNAKNETGAYKKLNSSLGHASINVRTTEQRASNK
nr:hypothetical protein BgiMline_008512 [Biomphalaria glabrata]